MDLDRLRYYTEWTQHANERAYAAPADPWKLLPVDPGNVERYTSDLRLNWGLGRVQAGPWDRQESCGRLTETTTYSGLIQRFEQGYDWEETALFERAREQLEDGEQFRGYGSVEAFREGRCAYLDDLYHSIRADGYRPNSEAGHENPQAEENQFEDAYVHQLEPLVAIGRDGEIIWVEGYHRLVIASILDIETIPVQVLCRHEAWQEVRDRIHGAAQALPPAVEDHRGHPDLAALETG